MQTRCCLLSIEDIDLDNTSYTLRPPYDSGPDLSLQESIGKFGLLQPPLLQRKNKHHIVLSGRKRLETVTPLGLREIPCLVLEEQVSLYQICETLLTHALVGSSLSPIEQAIFFSKIEGRLKEEQALALLPLLGIKPHPYTLQEFTTCLQLNQTAIVALHNGLIRQKTGIKLSKLSREDQHTVVRLIDHFKLGGSKQQKLVDYAIDLVMRTQRPFADFVLKGEQEDREDDNRPQLATAFLHRLETQCFPNKSAAEKKFRELQRSLQLPANITVQHTASFEDDRLTLSIVFDNQDMFLKRWGDITKKL